MGISTYCMGRRQRLAEHLELQRFGLASWPSLIRVSDIILVERN